MSDRTTVTVNLGYTLNIGNFQSLRVDLGCTDFVRDGENVDGAMDRVYSFVETKVMDKIEAAKKAAARRQPPTATVTQAQKRKGGKPRVTEQIDEIAAAVLSGAQEHLGGAIGNLQDRFVSRLEENFPRLSETLVRLGFFSKRFTEDR